MPVQPAGRIKLNTGARVPKLALRVWDAPTRLFHWAIVLLLILSYVSIEKNWIQIHFYSGYTVLSLLLFRVVWGFVGSDTSRFGNFLRNPLEGLRHLAQFGRREPDTEIGHNAAGGWMVLVILAALFVQTGTGLFAREDEDLIEGPLAHDISNAAGNWATTIHSFNFYYVILSLVALHILAIIAYAVVKRHDLVRAMVTGKKRLPATMRQPRFRSPALALVILLVCFGAVAAVVKLG